MKPILLAILLIPFITLAQVKEDAREKSKLETFSEKSGKIIQKTFIDIGKVKELKVEVLVFEDLTDNSKISGLRLEAGVYSTLGSSTKTAFLDKDEIDGLLKSLSYFKEKVFPSSPENYTEVTFSSRSGFSAGVFQDNKKKWSLVLKLEKYDSRSSVYLKDTDIDDLIRLIEKAKEN